MPTRRGKYRPFVGDLCLADKWLNKQFSQNGQTAFTAKKAASYGFASNMFNWLKQHGHVKAVSHGRYVVTDKGSRMFGKACRVKR